MMARTCPGCDRVFIPDGRDQRYCGRACRLASHNRQRTGAAPLRRAADGDEPTAGRMLGLRDTGAIAIASARNATASKPIAIVEERRKPAMSDPTPPDIICLACAQA